jgi:hypothetical protein
MPGARRAATHAVHAATVLLVGGLAVITFDLVDIGDLLDRSELPRGLSAARARAAQLWTLHAAERPIDVFSPPGTDDERTIVRYLHECTAPGDRIWEPTGNFATAFYADRGVVQHMFWYGGFRHAPAQQEQTLRWLEHERVPLLVIRGDADPLNVFRAHPLIRDYVRKTYVDVTSARARSPRYTGGRPLSVFAHRDLKPVRTYERLDLPCFAPTS